MRERYQESGAMQVMVVAAHPDDSERHGGGAVARWTRDGCQSPQTEAMPAAEDIFQLLPMCTGGKEIRTTQHRESLPLCSTQDAREWGGCDGSCGCGGRRLLPAYLRRFTVVTVTALLGVYAVTAWATGSACWGLCRLVP
jgi:hypothetical protein